MPRKKLPVPGPSQPRFIPVLATLRTKTTHQSTQCVLIGSKYCGWNASDKNQNEPKTNDKTDQSEQCQVIGSKYVGSKNDSDQNIPKSKDTKLENEKSEELESFSMSDDEFNQILHANSHEIT